MEIINHSKNYRDSNVTITAIEASRQLKIDLQHGETSSSFKIKLRQPNDEIFGLDILPLDIDYTCAITCAVTNLTGPILNCWRKNRGNWNAFLKCLQNQGITLVADTLDCLRDC